MISPAESRLRLSGLAEGLSFIFIDVHRHAAQVGVWPAERGRIVGSLHGGLFVIYVLAVVGIALVQKWRLARTILALAVSVIPFGPFLFHKRLQQEADSQIRN